MKIKNEYPNQMPSFEENFWKVINQNLSFPLKILKSKQSYQEAFYLCSKYFYLEKIIKSCNVSSLFYNCMLSIFEYNGVVHDSVRAYVIMIVLPQLHPIYYHQSSELLQRIKNNNFPLHSLIVDQLNKNFSNNL